MDPRIPAITSRTELPVEHRPQFDHIVETRGSVRGPFSVLMNSPEVGGRIARVGAYIRYEGVLPPATRELLILTTAREFESAYEWVVHRPIALESGVSETAVNAILNDEPLDSLPDSEASLVRFGRELLRTNEVTQSTFVSITEQHDDMAVLEITATIGYYAMLACIMNALNVQPDEDIPF